MFKIYCNFRYTSRSLGLYVDSCTENAINAIPREDYTATFEERYLSLNAVTCLSKFQPGPPLTAISRVHVVVLQAPGQFKAVVLSLIAVYIGYIHVLEMKEINLL